VVLAPVSVRIPVNERDVTRRSFPQGRVVVEKSGRLLARVRMAPRCPTTPEKQEQHGAQDTVTVHAGPSKPPAPGRYVPGTSMDGTRAAATGRVPPRGPSEMNSKVRGAVVGAVGLLASV